MDTTRFLLFQATIIKKERDKIKMENLGNSLSGLVDYLQKVAPEVWRILVKQQVINGWVYTVLGMLFLVFLLLLIPTLIKTKKDLATVRAALEKGRNSNKYFDESFLEDKEEDFKWSIVGVGFVQTIFLVAILSLFSNGALFLLNPEYYAIMSILEKLR